MCHVSSSVSLLRMSSSFVFVFTSSPRSGRIGLFALSEAFVMIEQETILSRAGQERMQKASWREAFDGLRLAVKHWWEVIWTSIIGLVIGVTPGAGASIAAFVAYQQSRVLSKTPEKYGTGHPAG